MARATADTVLERLVQYYRVVHALDEDGRRAVSSDELGALLQVAPTQVRKDLSNFGRFGRQGRGYSVRGLTEELRRILGLDQRWATVLIGIGRLGTALASYSGLRAEGFDLVGLYDIDPDVIGSGAPGNLVVRSVAELEANLKRTPANIGIVAVPAAEAQSIVDILVASGVRGILNYTPADVQVPTGIQIGHIDPLLVLQSMTYGLRNRAMRTHLATQRVGSLRGPG
jgi:redox-sensing transcriptional repressor